MLGFCCLSCYGKFDGGDDLGKLLFQGRSSIEEMRAIAGDLVKNLVVVGIRGELGFFFPTIVFEES